jgi:hypothetical protein
LEVHFFVHVPFKIENYLTHNSYTSSISSLFESTSITS